MAILLRSHMPCGKYMITEGQLVGNKPTNMAHTATTKKKHTSQSGYCRATSHAQEPDPNPQSRSFLSLRTGGKINRLSNIVLNASWAIDCRSISSWKVSQRGSFSNAAREISFHKTESRIALIPREQTVPRLWERNKRYSLSSIVDSRGHGMRRSPGTSRQGEQSFRSCVHQVLFMPA